MAVNKQRNRASEHGLEKRKRGVEIGIGQAQQDAEKEGRERTERAEKGLSKSAIPRFDPAGVEPEK